MGLNQILILSGVSILLGGIRQGRSQALLVFSGLVMYWLQPRHEPLNLIYWFPTLTLALAALSWALISTPETGGWKQNYAAALIIAALALLLGANRYLQFEELFIIETPRLQWVILAIVLFFAVAIVVVRFPNYRRTSLIIAAIGLVAALVTLKIPSAGASLFDLVAGIRGKDPNSVTGLMWLGFSYVSFRLLHTIFDRLAGRLPPISLADYVNYVIFFPAITAGPIDRIERFIRDLNAPIALDSNGWLEAGTRLVSGLFKKFVLADGLAWIAINAVYVQNLEVPGPSWILLYAYSLRIFFDFSGYTDIAIGLGRLLGVRLPDNFDAPYLKPNITQFWNSWHMTLTQWFRAYFFNPLTRLVRSSQRQVPAILVIFVAQVSTMVLIGMWHGITTGFLLWGIWHGLGLFIHNRWSTWVRPRIPNWAESPFGAAAVKYSGVFLTFNFVSLGWLFLSLQDPTLVWQTIFFLFGAA